MELLRVLFQQVLAPLLEDAVAGTGRWLLRGLGVRRGPRAGLCYLAGGTVWMALLLLGGVWLWRGR